MIFSFLSTHFAISTGSQALMPYFSLDRLFLLGAPSIASTIEWKCGFPYPLSFGYMLRSKVVSNSKVLALPTSAAAVFLWTLGRSVLDTP